jgi:drug/metabolite transporter (DMT)-like permease
MTAGRAAGRTALIVGCLLATWLVWGTTYLAIKVALTSFPPFFQIGTRLLVAGTLLLSWARWRGRLMPTRMQWRNGLLVGTIMLAANQGGVAYAEQTIASGLVVSFIAIVPALTTLASLPFGVRPMRLELCGIVAGFAGVWLLVRGNAFTASPAGLVAMTIAAVGWSIGSVLSQRVLPLAPGSAGFATQMICGGLVMLVLSILAGEAFHFPPQPLAAVAWGYLVIFGSLIAFVAYMVLLANAGPVLATSYAFANPLVGMLCGVFLAGERVSREEWIAVAIIVVSIMLVIVGRKRLESAAAGRLRRNSSRG